MINKEKLNLIDKDIMTRFKHEQATMQRTENHSKHKRFQIFLALILLTSTLLGILLPMLH